eukprot:CAMPEP_0119050542 /NCGR_PEP_ID=MMETSP1177-20130426/70529_1 /TAXON_ID=2985 /ORGANISM="Ochromonas sp, Strain CCMP1899" /LENGTH=304 /DNA_ID=CAMNT_0007029069 /DNA_START=72 /DNA_END=983 /DNA_ORIENTATION=-
MLPFELGSMLQRLPSPVYIRGEFRVTGTPLSLLTTPLGLSRKVGVISGLSPYQFEMFYWLQKSLDRSHPMKNMGEVLQYRRMSKHPMIWQDILDLWEEAASIYSKVIFDMQLDETLRSFAMSMNKSNAIDPLDLQAQHLISFGSILATADTIMRKKLDANFQLQHLDMQVSLNELHRHLNMLFKRVASDMVASTTTTKLQQAKLKAVLERMTDNYEAGLEALHFVSRNLDFANLTIKAGMHAGPEGVLSLTLSEILAQAPVLLYTVLSKQKNMGQPPLVPYMTTIKPLETGDIVIEVRHGSDSP